MNLVACKCPNCNASIKLNEKLEKGTCNYCGAEVYNEKSLNVEKVEISGKVIIEDFDITKNIEVAKKHYAATEYDESFKILIEIMSKDPFNYEALKLTMEYLVEYATDDYIFKHQNEINSYINKFKTVVRSSDDQALLEVCEINLDKVIKQNDKKAILYACAGVIVIIIVIIASISIYH